jgi:hypothetical protein
MASLVLAFSSEIWSAGCASSLCDRSLLAGVFESEYGRHCKGENRMADRAGHCTCGLGLNGIDRASDVMVNRGGMMWRRVLRCR